MDGRSGSGSDAAGLHDPWSRGSAGSRVACIRETLHGYAAAPKFLVFARCSRICPTSATGCAYGCSFAALSRVVCKLSGRVTEAARPDRDARLPAVEHVLATFAEHRLLFGSDWPVCTLAARYDRVVEVVHDTLGARLTPEFERKLFGENATAFYRL